MLSHLRLSSPLVVVSALNTHHHVIPHPSYLSLSPSLQHNHDLIINLSHEQESLTEEVAVEKRHIDKLTEILTTIETCVSGLDNSIVTLLALSLPPSFILPPCLLSPSLSHSRSPSLPPSLPLKSRAATSVNTQSSTDTVRV